MATDLRLVKKSFVIETPESDHRLTGVDEPTGHFAMFNAALNRVTTGSIYRSMADGDYRVNDCPADWYPLKVIWVGVEEVELGPDLTIDQETRVKWMIQYRHLGKEDLGDQTWRYDYGAPVDGFKDRQKARDFASRENEGDKIREYRVVKVTTTQRVELDDGDSG